MAIHEQDRVAILAAVESMRQRPYITRSIADLCYTTGMSASRLTDLFRKITGLSIYEQQNIFRMKMAMNLLRETALPITLIAKKVGYRSASAFARNFKKYTGVTPVAYRSENKN